MGRSKGEEAEGRKEQRKGEKYGHHEKEENTEGGK